MSMRTMAFDELRAGVRGDVILSDDAAYEEARHVYNGMIDRRPAVIIRAANVGDVMAGVNFARENGLDLAVRGGGHSVPGFGTCDDGVVIDLSGMRGVRVDPAASTARVEGGATWGDFNAATYPFGLATTGGIISTTGVAGLTLGGGIGYLTRGYGLSLDNLLSADVVTADGRFLVASEHEHADLFWALRGGGGNFGVVTSFEFRLHPVKDVYGGPMFYELSEAENVLRFYRDYIATAPEADGRLPGVPDRPAAPVHPGGSPRGHAHRDRGLLVGADRGGRERPEAVPRGRPGRGRARRPDAVPGAERRVRRAAALRAFTTTGRRTS